MIRIRYSSELQPGLHGRAEQHGRVTFIYLLPGLTPQQRWAALRRMRQQGRMGICPRLPVGQLVVALLADRVRTVFGQAGAIVRVHPAGSTLPVMALSVAITSFFVLSALSVHIVHLPPQAAGGSAATGPAVGRDAGHPLPTPSVSQSAGPAGGRQPAAGSTARGTAGPAPSGTPATGTVTSPGPGQRTSPGGGKSSSPDPVTVPSPGGSSTLTSTTASTPPAQDPAPSATSSGAASPDPAPTPKPTESTRSGNPSGQVCVDVGSFGICLGL